jgi:AraC-like DNA-binding protein
MRTTLRRGEGAGLERSCAPVNSLRFGCGAPGLQRAEARFATFSFSPHRHDTYAIGVTTAGVQAFRYRGERRICLPGQLHVLHPDELHDGGPATDAGFAYRILYVDPELLRDALGARPLPFVRDPVVLRQTAAAARVVGLLDEIDEPLSDLGRAEAIAVVADALGELAGAAREERVVVDLPAVERVRDHLAAHACEQTPAAELERIADLDRYSLARQFRQAYGTSPDRYRSLRRLARARAAIEEGVPLAEAAAATGFADQSHLTRQFVRAFGVTPGRFARLTSRAAEAS